jgi:hypothetical protein
MDFASYFSTPVLLSFVNVANIMAIIGGILYATSISSFSDARE